MSHCCGRWIYEQWWRKPQSTPEVVLSWLRKHAEKDYVEDCQLVCDTLETLLRFETLRAWAGEFLGGLSQSQNEPLKSAWFLECVAHARGWVFFQGKAGPPASTPAVEELFKAMPLRLLL